MKRVLITGGTRGVGLSLARMFALKDYQVVLTGTDQIKTTNATKLLNYYSNTNKTMHEGCKLDLSKLESIDEFCKTISQQDFDVVIHNAGMLSRNGLDTVTNSRQHKMFMVNAIGPMLITRSILPNMIKNKKGHILFFCPEYAIDAKTTMLTPYMQTKLAQTTFMRSVANMPIIKKSNIGVAGFWTKYGLYTDALIHRGIGTKENCMDPSIISEMVKLLLDEKPLEINGKVFRDHEYLTNKGINLDNFKLGNDVVPLDQLFVNSLIQGR